FFFQAEDGIRDPLVTGVQTCALPIFTDVAMPNLGGRGLVEELKELSPGMRVLFMSGYPKEEVFPDKGANRVPYLQKPFTSEALQIGRASCRERVEDERTAAADTESSE